MILPQNLEDLILDQRTFDVFGYWPKDLSHGSARLIVHKCSVCGLEKRTAFKYFLINRRTAHLGCRSAKIKQTYIERYGVEHLWKTSEGQEKRKQTMLKKYGVEYPSQSLEVQKKVEQTNLERYGVKHPLQSSQIQEKVRQTNIKKYGADNPRKSKQIKEKIKQTNLDKYGVEYPSQLSEIREKQKHTCFERYGVEIMTQLPENRNRLKEWCDENPNKLYTSKPELEMLGWVQLYYPGARKYKDGTFEIDIFISEINVGIEYNGLYYHQEDMLNSIYGVGSGKRYHLNKTKHFQAKNIRVVHIFEHEWRFRQEQVKSFLLSAMGKNEQRIGARKCILQWSSSSEDIQEVHRFLEQYHIQGRSINTKCVIKVLYNNELLAVATFGKHHRNNKDWVLTRFCTKTNYTIQGILSKISKLASQQLKEDVISWADYRLSNGNGYEKAGWIFEELLPPDYFYHRYGKVIPKQSRQKRIVKTPKNMTERQHAKQDGLERVYDCGKIRYRYLYKNE
jgi:hypothetical protein